MMNDIDAKMIPNTKKNLLLKYMLKKGMIKVR